MSQTRRSTRLASEGAVIVLSILLAFWIDAWWGDRQARIAEGTVLESIRGELEQNRTELDDLRRRSATQFARIDAFLGSTPDGLRALPQDSVSEWISAVVVTWTYDGDDSAAELFLGSSTPVTAHARAVRGVLARWVRLVDDMDEEKRTVWDLGVDAAGRLALYATDAASDGSGLLHDVAERLGPELLAQLRMDDEFVAAALNKFHYQTVYVLELEEASVVLDSLRALVREGTGARRSDVRAGNPGSEDPDPRDAPHP